jgi:hypothetical protein
MEGVNDGCMVEEATLTIVQQSDGEPDLEYDSD